MKPLPISTDVAALVGPYAEGVENRSLLMEKFVLPKNWLSDTPKLDTAGRWSLLRVCEGGSKILNNEARGARNKATRPGRSKNLDTSRLTAELLPHFANTRAESADAQGLRQLHSRRFLANTRESMGKSAAVFCARLQSRMALNLSDGLIENAGISLDRLFGLPKIPGSALKGVARHAALADLKSPHDDDEGSLLARFVAVFGCAEADFGSKGSLAGFSSFAKSIGVSNRRGGITFLPAHPVEECKIEVDLTNVHTPRYYTGQNAGSLEALKDESPRPNPFPVIAAGSAFGFTIALNTIGKRAADPDGVLADARRWLETALTVNGIGAKTGAGYGWFALDRELDARLEAEAEKAKKVAREKAEKEEAVKRKQAEEAKRIEGLSPEEQAKESLLRLDSQAFAETAKALGDEPEPVQRAFLELLLHEKRDRWKQWKKKKPDTKAAILPVAEKLNVQLP